MHALIGQKSRDKKSHESLNGLPPPGRATVTDYEWYTAFGGTYVARGVILPERPLKPRWTGRVHSLWEELEQLQTYAREKLGSAKFDV